MMASTEGGMEIEEVADKTPEKILKVAVDPDSWIPALSCPKNFKVFGPYREIKPSNPFHF